jgi:hypothetical protein
MKFRPLRSRAVVFLEGTKNGKLETQITKGGIHLVPTGGMDGLARNMGMQNRWAFVLACGPKCNEIQPKDRVCIYSQKWTEGMNFDNEWYWFTDEEHIMLIDMLYRETNGKEKTSTGDVLNLDEHLNDTSSGSFKVTPRA